MIPKLILTLLSFACVASSQVTLATIRQAPANTWIQVPNTHLQDVKPTGWSANVIAPWSGGAYDTKRDRLIVWGGGHNDYNGNEVYVFDVPTLKWLRLTNPSSPGNCTQINSDGSPASRHTYNGVAYIAHADRLFICGGCVACTGGGCNANKVFTFDFATLTWHDMQPSGIGPVTCCGDAATYDSVSRKIWYMDSGAWACGTSSSVGLFSYDFDTNRWTKINSDLDCGAAAVDTKRNTLINVGARDYANAYNLNSPATAGQHWSATGATNFAQSGSNGLEYDPVSDKIVGWNGGAVYALDPVTKTWTAYNPSGAPAGCSNGTFGRWRYVRSLNAFIVVNAIDQNVYFYKFTTGAGTGISGKETAVQVPSGLTAMPNPLSSTTRISFHNPGANAEMTLLDVSGRVVKRVEGVKTSSVVLDAGKLVNGVYVVKVKAGLKQYVKRLLVQK